MMLEIHYVHSKDDYYTERMNLTEINLTSYSFLKYSLLFIFFSEMANIQLKMQKINKSTWLCLFTNEFLVSAMETNLCNNSNCSSYSQLIEKTVTLTNKQRTGDFSKHNQLHSESSPHHTCNCIINSMVVPLLLIINVLIILYPNCVWYYLLEFHFILLFLGHFLGMQFNWLASCICKVALYI